MKTNDIKNELVKTVVETAIKNGYRVTLAKISGDLSFVEKYGTPYRIRKSGTFGWDVLVDLSKKLKTTMQDLLKNNTGENNTPGFFVFSNSIVITDPNAKNSIKESSWREGKDDVVSFISRNFAEFLDKIFGQDASDKEVEEMRKEFEKCRTPKERTKFVLNLIH